VSLLITAGSPLQSRQSEAEPPKGAIASYKLSIEEQEGTCILRYDGPRKGKIRLILPPPCEFVRDPATGAVQHFRYKNKKRSGGGFFEAILVIGGPRENARSDKLMKDGCGTHLQPVSLSSRGVVAGSVGSGVVVCPLDGLDEKFFGFLARPI
jgi:hypothetical protein